MQFLVVYAKAVDDKELGVYIEGVYFGGVVNTQVDAGLIARECVNGTRGGTAIPKIIPIDRPNSILELFVESKARFAKLEKEMIDNEEILLANQRRAKSKRR